jgi:hypothetical protein
MLVVLNVNALCVLLARVLLEAFMARACHDRLGRVNAGTHVLAVVQQPGLTYFGLTSHICYEQMTV